MSLSNSKQVTSNPGTGAFGFSAFLTALDCRTNCTMLLEYRAINYILKSGAISAWQCKIVCWHSLLQLEFLHETLPTPVCQHSVDMHIVGKVIWLSLKKCSRLIIYVPTYVLGGKSSQNNFRIENIVHSGFSRCQTTLGVACLVPLLI